MIPFQYVRPKQQKAAIDALARDNNAMFIAGGTNLLDLMKRYVVVPQKLVDINQLPLHNIEQLNGGIRIGALVTNTALAEHKLIKEKYPLLSQAVVSGASAQLRNMATVGGNMMQRTRCYYFYDTALPCNKREPGTGCGALDGVNRMHAIFGFSDKCIAVHPSDMSVALAALDATVQVSGPKGERSIAFTDFHRLPGEQPEKDTNLHKNELITSVFIPDAPFARNACYLKVRERASFAFALVSVAAALDISNNSIREARLAMGGVAHKPWRLFKAEKTLKGMPVSEASFRQAAAVAMEGARAFEHNAYKIKMAPETIVHALKTAAGIV
ncbi:xanthine dehydrogenase family protein subunit M [Cesiribacter sp. SM1]|uniref:FAD binding domain-containing protein n=1 Tax=Cesiribacter sp. SM1 TaxID=2861196 RepID=UPI001CD442AB|nr:xanthine dehydrogenase family protein subunit M [Cesiribacter sp. SM1]